MAAAHSLDAARQPRDRTRDDLPADPALAVGQGAPGAEADDVGRNISLKLGRITRQLVKRFARALEGEDVTRSQWGVIVVVAQNPGATQRLIAEALDVSEAAAGRMIERLCGDGLLERRRKPEDRRAHRVYLTAAAQPLLARLGTIAATLEEETFRDFAPEELARLDALLEKMYRNVTT